jgi:hypothetical protein
MVGTISISDAVDLSPRITRCAAESQLRNESAAKVGGEGLQIGSSAVQASITTAAAR